MNNEPIKPVEELKEKELEGIVGGVVTNGIDALGTSMERMPVKPEGQVVGASLAGFDEVVLGWREALDKGVLGPLLG